jgi:predicted acyltransferase
VTSEATRTVRSGADARLVSLDVVRGLAVAAMLAVNNEGINPGHPAWLRHPVWHGFTVADTVFPLFLFCIGVSMTLSSRAGRAFRVAAWPMVRRSLILFALGVGLSALKQHQIVLAGVLQHIAVTSLLAWLVLQLPRRAQYGIAAAILVGCATVGLVGGFDQGSTIDGAIDRFLFGRDTAEGLLVMVCSVVNVLAGAWLGPSFRTGDRREIVRRLAAWTVAPLTLGLVLIPVIPVNKRLWTPSYALIGVAVSAAVTLGAYWLCDLRGVRRGVGWLREMGANPLVVYVACTALAALVPDDVRLTIVRWVSGPVPRPVASVMWSAVWILLAWAIAHELWRRKILIKL